MGKRKEKKTRAHVNPLEAQGPEAPYLLGLTGLRGRPSTLHCFDFYYFLVSHPDHAGRDLAGDSAPFPCANGLSEGDRLVNNYTVTSKA